MTANLGVKKIPLLAAAVDAALRQDADEESVNSKVSQLESAMAQVLAALTPLAQSAAAPLAIQPAAAKLLLTRLEALLVAGSFETAGLAGQSRQELATLLGDEATELERRIARFDFEGALVLVRNCLTDLGT